MSEGTPPSGGTAARRARLEAQRQAAPAPGSAATGSPTGPVTSGRGSAPSRAEREVLDPDRLAALEEERDFLLASLDDLEREHGAGDIDEADYLELRDDYTARAAAVLRAIDDRHAARADARARRGQGRSRRWVGVLLVVVLALGAGVALAQASGQRAPGGAVSGDIRQSSRDRLLEAQQWTAQANGLLQEGRVQEALDAFGRATAAYEAVLAVSPDNLEALTYGAWLYHQLAVVLPPGEEDLAGTAAQLDARALAGLDRAIEVDPTYPDARIFRAILRRNAGDAQGALADLDAVPPDAIPPMMRPMVEGLRSGLGGGPPATTPGTAPGGAPG